MCDDFVPNFDVVIIVEKSKFPVVVPNSKRSLYKDMCRPKVLFSSRSPFFRKHYESHIKSEQIISDTSCETDDTENKVIVLYDIILCCFDEQDVLRLTLVVIMAVSCGHFILIIMSFFTSCRNAFRYVLDLPVYTHSMSSFHFWQTVHQFLTRYKQSARFIYFLSPFTDRVSLLYLLCSMLWFMAGIIRC
jgi:hypothetical protein